MAQDFSAGRRLRIPMTVYEPETRNFRQVPDAVALVTVQSEREEKRLWKAIGKTIQAGEWRDGANRGADRSEPAPADV